jgi:hypothetical protein
VTELDLERAAKQLRQQVATAHEHVGCPKCNAPRGERCCAMPLGWGGVCAQVGVGRTLKHSHTERLRAAGISLR